MVKEVSESRPPAEKEAALRFVQQSARLLLEYNTRTKILKNWVARIARHLGLRVRASVVYREIRIINEDGLDLSAEVSELRNNVAINLTTCEVLDSFCEGRLQLEEASQRLGVAETTSSQYALWFVAIMFGISTSAFAWLLGGDPATILVSGAAAGLGLVARRELGKRNLVFFVQPFAAGLIGGILAGIAIRLGWIRTPELCLVLPALMMVPGPHFINGFDDLLENHIQTGVFRLVLALTIVLSAAFGLLLGDWLTLGAAPVAESLFTPTPFTLPLDVVLAGVAACGIGISFNSPGRVLWISILCGVVGHGIRFLCLQQQMGLASSTLLACLAIGVIANIAVNRLGLPFSAVAFAGAVTMMPGLLLFESIAGAIRIVDAGKSADSAMITAIFTPLFEAGFVVAAMGIGLTFGARLADRFSRQLDD